MADDRTDAQKDINNTLTPPQQDRAGGNDPPGARGGEQVPVDSGGQHARPGYAAPPGRTIDRNADPAAPEVDPGDISHHPGGGAAGSDTGAGRGPGEAAPPGTIPDRAGGGQMLSPPAGTTNNPAGNRTRTAATDLDEGARPAPGNGA